MATAVANNDTMVGPSTSHKKMDMDKDIATFEVAEKVETKVLVTERFPETTESKNDKSAATMGPPRNPAPWRRSRTPWRVPQVHLRTSAAGIVTCHLPRHVVVLREGIGPLFKQLLQCAVRNECTLHHALTIYPPIHHGRAHDQRHPHRGKAERREPPRKAPDSSLSGLLTTTITLRNVRQGLPPRLSRALLGFYPILPGEVRREEDVAGSTEMTARSRGSSILRTIFDAAHALATRRLEQAIAEKSSGCGGDSHADAAAGMDLCVGIHGTEGFYGIHGTYAHRTGLPELPEAALLGIVECLDQRTKMRLAATCKSMLAVASGYPVGLRCELYSHQRRSLEWMIKTERRLPNIDRLPETPAPLDAFFLPRKENDDTNGSHHRQNENANEDEHKASKGIWVHASTGWVEPGTPETIPGFSRFSRENELVQEAIPPLRSGLLCDDPGLGKTVTVLALILALNGTCSMSEDAIRPEEIAEKKKMEIDANRSYAGQMNWQRKMVVTRLFRQLCDELDELLFEYSQEHDNKNSTATILQETTQLKKKLFQIAFPKQQQQQRNDGGGVGGGGATWSDIKHTLRTHLRKMAWYDNGVAEAAESVTSNIEQELASGKRRTMARTQATGEAARLSSLPTSTTTLIVVPAPLLDHWSSQIRLHVDWDALDISRRPGDAGRVLYDINARRPMFTVEEMRRKLIVVTTFHRLTIEARRQRLSKKQSSLRSMIFRRIVVDEGHSVGRSTRSDHAKFLCSLCARSRWILTGTPAALASTQQDIRTFRGLLGFLRHRAGSDEENHMSKLWRESVAQPVAQGCAGGLTRATYLLSEVMMRHTTKDIALLLPKLKRVCRLMDPSPVEIQCWNNLVAGAKMNILTASMGDEEKGYSVSLLNPINREQRNKTMRNLRMSCCGDTGRQRIEVDGLAEMEVGDQVRNCWRNQKNVVVSAEEVERHVSAAQRYIGSLREHTPGNCGCGVRNLLQRLLAPCGHTFCPECVDPQHVVCPTCGSGPWDADDFAFLQPGLTMHWEEHLKESLAKIRSRTQRIKQHARPPSWTPTSPSMSSSARSTSTSTSTSLTFREKEAVSSEVQLIKSVLGTENPLDDGWGDVSTKAQHIISSIRKLCREREPGLPPVKCLVFSSMRRTLDLVGTALIHALGKDAVAEFWSKGCRGAELRKFVEGVVQAWKCRRCGFENEWGFKTCQRPFVTVVVDERGRGRGGGGGGGASSSSSSSTSTSTSTSLDVKVEKERLHGHFLGRVIHQGQPVTWDSEDGDMCSGHVRTVDLCRSKRTEPTLRKVDCPVLLLGKDGSHGLDLSMVERVFLVDKIWDPALEDQVVARAWRLGSQRKEVAVEQLLLKGTLEETIHAMPTERPANLGIVVLKSLRFIRA